MCIKKQNKTEKTQPTTNKPRHWKTVDFVWVAATTAFSIQIHLLNESLLNIGWSSTGGSQKPQK